MPGATIYAVDDDPVIAELLTLVLGSAGYAVTTLPDADAVLALVRRAPPRILVLDLNMPGASGLDVLAALRLDGLLPGMKVLLLTGDDNTSAVAQALRMGAAGYLLKPFNTAQLLRRISMLLGHTVPDATRAAPDDEVEAINPVIAGLVGTYGVKTVDRLLTSLAGQLGRLEQTTHAPEAEIAQEAHAIKGAAASLGFTTVSGACSALEIACQQGAAIERALREAAQACASARRQIDQHLQTA